MTCSSTCGRKPGPGAAARAGSEAVRAAIFQAAGVRVRSMPLAPDGIKAG